ncbi:MAG TPA: hypothetical protein VNK94_09260 [Gaiellaceae bacterium]|jgi:hypothetical protein|nr:hypothetical protein [Gaiellaceae bacterium]
MRLHLACAPHGTPRAAALVILPQALRGGETVVCDLGYAGREFDSTLASLDVRVVRPTRRDKPDRSLYLATIPAARSLPAFASTTSSAVRVEQSSTTRRSCVASTT